MKYITSSLARVAEERVGETVTLTLSSLCAPGCLQSSHNIIFLHFLCTLFICLAILSCIRIAVCLPMIFVIKANRSIHIYLAMSWLLFVAASVAGAKEISDYIYNYSMVI